MGDVIDMESLRRARKARMLRGAIERYAKAQGPHNPAVCASVARSLTAEGWLLVASVACVEAPSATTKAIVLEELEDLERAARFVEDE